jgi:hypothetical protein
MDIETSAAIGHVGERIDALEKSLRGEFRHGLAENRRHADIQFEALRGDVGSLREDVGSLRDDVRILADGFATVSGELADHRRTTQVLFEAIRDDIRTLAEGFAHVSTKLDALNR